MTLITSVGCCPEFGSLLEELNNSQEADPGYRHIRLTVTVPGGGATGKVRVRFCPWCGTQFRIEAPREAG